MHGTSRLTTIGFLFASLAACPSPTCAQPGEPVDYAAIFSERLGGIPEEDRAFDLYAEANRLLLDKQALGELQHAEPGDAAWPDALRLLEECEPILLLAEQIASKPHLGYRVLRPGDSSGAWQIPADPDHLKEGVGPDDGLMNMTLPHLGVMRSLARLERLRLRRALQNGGTDEAIDCVARLCKVSEHAAEQRIAVAQLVSVSLGHWALEATSRILDDPKPLTPDQLQRLARLTGGLDARLVCSTTLADDALIVRDFIQAVYGVHGDELVTQEGSRHLRSLIEAGQAFRDAMNEAEADPSIREAEPDERRKLVEEFVWSIFQPRISKRSETLADFESIMAAIEADAAIPVWEWSAYPGESTVNSINAEYEAAERYSLAVILTPPLEMLGRTPTQLRQERDALRTRIAIEQFRLVRGRWPGSLAELVPEFLDRIPQDRADGNPLRYRLDEQGEPLLYSLGPDRDDDGGVPTPPGRELRFYFPDELASARTAEPDAPAVPDGDWVHWRVQD